MFEHYTGGVLSEFITYTKNNFTKENIDSGLVLQLLPPESQQRELNATDTIKTMVTLVTYKSFLYKFRDIIGLKETAGACDFYFNFIFVIQKKNFLFTRLNIFQLSICNPNHVTPMSMTLAHTKQHPFYSHVTSICDQQLFQLFGQYMPLGT